MLTKLILILFPFLIFSQTNDISGVWLEEKKQSHIEIYKNKNGLYEGKVIWLAEPLDENGNIKKDKENPNPKLREKKLEGLIIIKELEATNSSQARQALFEKLVAQMYQKGKAISVAGSFEIDAVIDPKDTREWLTKGLKAAKKEKKYELNKRFIDVW